MFTTIELFAGAGGLALGVEKAGFNTIGLIEFDKDACDTLRTNRPEWNVICDDIANISCHAYLRLPFVIQPVQRYGHSIISGLVQIGFDALSVLAHK